MENVVLTPDLKSKIKFEIQTILTEVHKHPDKQIPHDSMGRLNFSCPYCHDSTSDPKKKRGNLYWSNLYYHCYNDGCGVHKSILNFFKDFKVGINDDDFFSILSFIRLNKTEYKAISDLNIQSFKKLNDVAISKSDFMEKMKIYSINKDTWMIYDYLKGRFLHLMLDNFAFNPRSKQLYIFNYNFSRDKILGYQIRNMVVNEKYSSAKYLTFTIDKACQKLNIEHEIDEELIKLSSVFNIMNIDYANEFTIFEGPIDSFFMRNSIALTGLSKMPFNFDEFENVRYFYDNDIGGKKKAIEKLNLGKKIFLWEKFLKDNKLNNYNIKDLNDIVINAYKYNKDALKKINDYFSNDSYDMVNV
jgi:hypothetical protein